jgi:hypothetical protein
MSIRTIDRLTTDRLTIDKITLDRIMLGQIMPGRTVSSKTVTRIGKTRRDLRSKLGHRTKRVLKTGSTSSRKAEIAGKRLHRVRDGSLRTSRAATGICRAGTLTTMGTVIRAGRKVRLVEKVSIAATIRHMDRSSPAAGGTKAIGASRIQNSANISDASTASRPDAYGSTKADQALAMADIHSNSPTDGRKAGLTTMTTVMSITWTGAIGSSMTDIRECGLP